MKAFDQRTHLLSGFSEYYKRLSGTKKLGNHRNYLVTPTVRTTAEKQIVFPRFSWQTNVKIISSCLDWNRDERDEFLSMTEHNFPLETISIYSCLINRRNCFQQRVAISVTTFPAWKWELPRTLSMRKNRRKTLECILKDFHFKTLRHFNSETADFCQFSNRVWRILNNDDPSPLSKSP